MEYTRQVVALVLENREVLDSIKYRVTANLIPDSFTAAPQRTGKEGETWSIGGNVTRVPRNTNRLAESLSDLTCDIDYATSNALDDAERLALGMVYSGEFEFISTEATVLAAQAVGKLTDFLNGN